MTAAIAGVGYSPFTTDSGTTILDLADQACRAAIDDAGIDPGVVDGIGSFQLLDDSVPSIAVATNLALPSLRWIVDLNYGGLAPSHLVWLAATAVDAGVADAVLVFRALNGRSGARVGTGRFAGPGGQYRYPIGYSAYLMYIAMWAQRYLHETGQGPDDLAAVAVRQRALAADNPRALLRDKPLSTERYFELPVIADPFRAADCTVEVDGACAVLVTSLARARDLRRPPAVVASGALRSTPRPGLDIADHTLWDDFTRNYTWLLRDELYGRAGVGPADVDFAQIYDCFTSTVLMGVEGLGLCERGEAGEWVRDERIPLNTNGGLLSEGYLHGMNTVAESASYVHRGLGEVGVVTSGALVDGSALIVTADR